MSASANPERSKSIVIRCIAGSDIGMGHLVRCRVLARAARGRGVRSIMAGPEDTLRIAEDDVLFDEWTARPEWTAPDEEAAFLISLAERHDARYAILDDYRSDGEHQTLIRNAGIRSIQQYDASQPQRFAAELIVNCSPAERAEFYKDCLLRDDIRFLHGPDYSVLRPDFLRRPRCAPKTSVRRILLSFGGGDDRGAILFSLSELSPLLSEDIGIVVMIGSRNPRRAEIAAYIDAHGQGRIRLAIDPPDVPDLMMSCDLVVLGGGTTSFEAAYCGLPMLLMPIAGNQHAMGQGWEDRDAGRFLGIFPEVEPGAMRDAAIELTENPAMLTGMSRAALDSMDGQGTERLLNALLDE